MTRDQYIDRLQHELVHTSRKVIDGSIHPILGVREIVRRCHEIGAQDDEEFVALRAIESETEQFPLGETRNRCAADYLARMDAELGEYLETVWPELKKACERILERYI